MSRLNNLYEAIETLRKEGLPVNEELEKKARQLEEEIIKKEILPILSRNIEPALQQVKRELVLVVDYIPGQPLSLHLSRKGNVVAEIPDAKQIVLDPEVRHGQRKSNGEGGTHSPASSLIVHFPDGIVIADKYAADTLEKTIRKIGVSVVRKVVEDKKLVFCKIPVISNRKDSKYGNAQRDLGGGWLLLTHSNNAMKKEFLEKVSQALNLGLVVELIK